MEYYSTPEDVIQYTGIQPGDLNLEDDDPEGEDPKTAADKRTALLEKWLKQITSLIHGHQKMNYLELVDNEELEEVPAGIHNIAMRMAANMVGQAVLRRETPIVKIDDFAVKMVSDAVMTKDIRTDLKELPHNKEGLSFF